MIYPDWPLELWFKKYPALQEGLPLCSCEPNYRLFRTTTLAGMECMSCDTSLWMKVKAEDNQRFLELLR